jgi:PDZ domain
VRWALSLIVVTAAAASADAAPQSDPAFLGISMGWMNRACSIGSVTIGSPASDAGIAELDDIAAIDAVPIDSPTACADVTEIITRHSTGDVIDIELERHGERITVKPVLSTRSEVLARRVGQRAFATDLIDTEGRHWDTAAHRGTLVVGAFDVNCAGCTALVDRVAERLAHRTPAADSLAVITSERDMSPDALRAMRGSMPIALADPTTYANLATTDRDRVFFMVIDCRGVVKLVAPIVPDADDIPAAIDEVLAAAEQAEHARTRR